MDRKKSKPIEKQVSELLAAAGREVAPPDEAFLKRLREESAEAFMTAPPEDRRRSASLRLLNVSTLKWSIPAAAAVILAILAVWPGSNGNGRAYGMADAPELLRRAHTLHMAGRMYLPPYVVPGQKQTEIPYEVWLDSQNARLRQTYPSYIPGPEGVEVVRGEIVSDGRYKMWVNHTDRSVIFYRLNDFYRALQSRRNAGRLYNRLFGGPEEPEGFRNTGQEDIDGETFDVWERVIGEAQLGVSTKAKWWLAPNTGRIARIHTWGRRDGTEDWRPILQFDTIQRDVVLPPAIFETTPPSEYTLANTKESAEIPELQYEGGASVGGLSYRGHIAFKLSDHSIILGWSSVDEIAPSSQADLFANLEPGGPLPKLPVEVYGLKQIIGDEEVVYAGKHLAYTRNGDQFYEWSIYVPEQIVPGRALSSYYRILHRFNVAEPDVRGTMVLNVSQPIGIDADDFDALVRGAMAELSDDGLAPEHVTHEKVMEIIQETRTAPGR